MSVDRVPVCLDVLIVGAGLSGIGAACYLQKEHPAKSWAILEARAVPHRVAFHGPQRPCHLPRQGPVSDPRLRFSHGGPVA